MSISLVSTPIVGFDLVRHPAGSNIAQILLDGLSLGPQDLQLYTPDRARTYRRLGAWNTVHDIVDARGAGSLSGSILAPRGTPEPGFPTIVDTLLRSMILDLDDLERLIRSDILLWTSSPTGPRSTLRAVPRGDDLPDTELVKCAGDALIDSVAALWMEHLDAETAAILREPHQLVKTLLPARPADVGPGAESVGQFLSTLRALGTADRNLLRSTANALRPVGPEWAAAVHEASWAALTTGRIRAAAAAQLLGVQAFHTAGFTTADGADGLWNTISGHLQAETMSDVLSATTYDFLTRAWQTAFGDASHN